MVMVAVCWVSAWLGVLLVVLLAIGTISCCTTGTTSVMVRDAIVGNAVKGHLEIEVVTCIE